MTDERQRMSIDELEALYEQMGRELTELENAVTKRRIKFIRQGKLLELMKRIRELSTKPDVQKVIELAEDVGL